MSEKKQRSIGLKLLASVSSITLVVSLVVLLVVGANLATSIVAAVAFGGLAVPAVAAGDTLVA